MTVVIPFSAVVLTGGSSTRMGRDKATAASLDGSPLAERVATALRAAGAAEVLAVGGDIVALRALGLDARPDRHPGEGPLGGIVCALGEAAHDLVVIVATDLGFLTADVVLALVTAAEGHDAAVARTDRIEPLCAAWWRPAAGPHLARAFTAGERAPHRALHGLSVVAVDVDPSVLRNLNTPGDLTR